MYVLLFSNTHTQNIDEALRDIYYEIETAHNMMFSMGIQLLPHIL